MSTKERYERVRAEVDLACEKAGRDPHEVLLLAVSKTVDLDQVQEAIEGGAHAFGENRPDELLRKRAAFPQETPHSRYRFCCRSHPFGVQGRASPQDR